MKGTVKWFDEKKGFGFILGSDELEYFVHFKSIQGTGYKTLEDNAEVDFKPNKGVKGWEANDVKVF